MMYIIVICIIYVCVIGEVECNNDVVCYLGDCVVM